VSNIRFLAGHARPYRKDLAIGGACALLEVVAGLAQPWPLRVVVDDVLGAAGTSADRPVGLLVTACAALVVIVALAAFFDYWATRLLSSSGLRIANDVRDSVFSHFNRLSLRFHGEHRVGDLTTRLTGDADRAQDLVVQSLAVLLPNALLLVGMTAVMFWLDPLFALVALAATPVLVYVVWTSTKRLKAASRRARKADGDVAAAASEHLAAMQLVQAFSLEDTQSERFGELTGNSLRAGLEATRYQARFSPAVDITAVVSTAMVMGFGALRVLDGKLTPGELLVFLSYVGSMYKPVKALAKLSNSFSKGMVSVERIRDVLAEAPQIVDHPYAAWMPPTRGMIELLDVSFTYGRELALDHVDLTVQAGETVALVGPTGAGKSTIASLVPRLIDPTEGQVCIDGVDLRNVSLRSVRRQVSMVLQDCTLLRGTLRDNIAIGRPWASDADIERAARLALVDEFSSRLPLGLDTPIGERGANLSGGQRQRVAIARAILRDAPILILDEPTSALDPASEELIIAALENLPRARTTIVVAHRLSTIEHADRIVVLEGGRIVEEGTHGALMSRDGVYRRFRGPSVGQRRWERSLMDHDRALAAASVRAGR
jgi:ABC-type multidrug transport system fused ATPase/permease subunit